MIYALPVYLRVFGKSSALLKLNRAGFNLLYSLYGFLFLISIIFVIRRECQLNTQVKAS